MFVDIQSSIGDRICRVRSVCEGYIIVSTTPPFQHLNFARIINLKQQNHLQALTMSECRIFLSEHFHPLKLIDGHLILSFQTLGYEIMVVVYKPDLLKLNN